MNTSTRSGFEKAYNSYKKFIGEALLNPSRRIVLINAADTWIICYSIPEYTQIVHLGCTNPRHNYGPWQDNNYTMNVCMGCRQPIPDTVKFQANLLEF